MILYSWNVNGLRAAAGKGWREWLACTVADVICLQEIKAMPWQLEQDEAAPNGWETWWNPARAKKGYSGTAVLTRPTARPLSVHTELPNSAFQGEGRLQLLEYPAFFLCNVYFPNGQMSEERLAYKLGYYNAFLFYAEGLRQKKPVVVCGDFNTAHRPIDLAWPKKNEKKSGFLPIERAWIDRFERVGYVDIFRRFESGPGQYTWWSFRTKAREKNVGWRIDYFLVSLELVNRVIRAWIEPEVVGSDHCPVGLELLV